MRSITKKHALVMVVLMGLSSVGVADMYSDAVNLDNPTAYWRFEETSGVVAGDQTGTYDATYVGSPTLGVAGAAGNGIGLNGTNQQVQRDIASTLVPGSGDFTVEAWMKTNTAGADQRLVTWYAGENPGNPGLYTLFCEDVAKFVIRGNDNALRVLEGTKTITDGKWHQLVGVYDRTNGVLALYVDGALEASSSVTLSAMDLGATPAAPLRLGAGKDGVAGLNGSLDEVAIYSTALSADRIAAHYTAVPEPATLGMLTLGAVAGVLRRKKQK